MGIGKGARVVLYLPNIPQAVIAFFGVIKAGAVAVFTPPMTDADELTRQVKLVEARALVTLNLWAGMAGQVQKNSGLPLLVLTDAGEYLSLPKRLISRSRNRGLDVSGAMHFRRWISGQSNQSPTVEVAPEDMAVIQFTGGTTGEAKGVMLSHCNLVANALQTRHWLPKAEEGRERSLCVIPFSQLWTNPL
jgi:long-chain acyl-CoA synthetase